MLVVLKETYCNKVNIQITQRDDFILKNTHSLAYSFVCVKGERKLRMILGRWKGHVDDLENEGGECERTNGRKRQEFLDPHFHKIWG